ncbi:PAS domain-containing protein [Sorangium sp. So ce1389]|uniref:PAS domain-containing protein n=1 Tax=Sorangium sp. So ce1389 TaxID=3133336 RepID=UPI003F6229C4
MSTPGGNDSIAAENARLRARVEELERRLGDGAPPPGAQGSAGGPRISYEALFDVLPVPIVVFRTDGQLAAINDATIAWFKARREDLVGAFNLLRDPESVARGFAEPFLRAVAGEVVTVPATPYVINQENNADVARRCWLEVTYLPLRDESGVRYVVSLTRDVTSHKEAEAKQRQSSTLLEAIIDNAPLLIYARDTEGRFTVANRQIEAALGKPKGALLGRMQREFASEEITARFDAQDREVLASTAPLVVEDRVEMPDGTHVYMTTKFALRDDEGKATGVCGISADITERVRAEEQNLRLHEQMFRVREETLRSISTPLLPIAAGVLVMPLVGDMTRERADQVIEVLLHGISDQQARIALLDVTGMPEAGEEVTDALVRAARSVRLLGAEVVITGIRPSVAQALVGLEADLGGIVTKGTLERGVAYALSRRAQQRGAAP